jgi:hypothetical protein
MMIMSDRPPERAGPAAVSDQAIRQRGRRLARQALARASSSRWRWVISSLAIAG